MRPTIAIALCSVLLACSEKQDSPTTTKAPATADSKPDEPVPATADAKPDKPVPAAAEAKPDKPVPAAADAKPDKPVPPEPAVSALPKEVSALREEFAKHWSLAGAKRKESFCNEKTDERIFNLQDVLGQVPPPAGVDAKKWKKHAADVQAYLQDASRGCGPDPQIFEKMIKGAHDSLEELVKLSSGK